MPFYCDGEGAESFIDFVSRARLSIDKLKGLVNSHVVIFSHEQFIKMVLWLINNDGKPVDFEK